jgi:uncharacterized protein (TIGR00255 family)
MTAYGRSLRVTPLGKWLVEICSVNRKNLDFNIFVPKDLFAFEIEIRKWLSKELKRGYVTVKVSWHPACPSFELSHQVEYLKSMKEKMTQVCTELGCSREDITFPFLYEQVQESIYSGICEQEQALHQDLEKGVKEALQGLMKMKEVEGSTLMGVLEQHLTILFQLLTQIQGQVVGTQDRYRKKLLDKLQSYKELTGEDQERVLREAFFYSEKVDVEEEIHRMFSHLGQFRSLFSSSELSVGRTMEFLVQEMVRELNTLSAKSDDLEVSYLILKMKGEVEKIREQVQNIE